MIETIVFLWLLLMIWVDIKTRNIEKKIKEIENKLFNNKQR
jgi:hypothetical protein